MYQVSDQTGRRFVVTGANSGTGKEATRRIAAAGGHVVMGVRSEDKGHAAAAEIRRDVPSASLEVRRIDLADLASVRAFADGILSDGHQVDVLINNAGVMPISRLDVYDVDGWDRTIDTNIKGVLYAIAAVLPRMKAQRSGHIVTIASVAGHRINGGSAVYAASKHAVRVISEALRQEVTADGIRATIVSPGATRSELFDKIDDPASQRRLAGAAEMALPADTVARAIAYAIGEPDEVDVNEIIIRPQAQDA